MMDNYGYGTDMTTEYGSGLSVDDILREYQGESFSPAPPSREPHADGEDVKIYQPKGAVSRMEDEARQYISDLAKNGYAGLYEEDSYAAPAYTGDGESAEDDAYEPPVRHGGRRAKGASVGQRGLDMLNSLGGLVKTGIGQKRGRRAAFEGFPPEEPAEDAYTYDEPVQAAQPVEEPAPMPEKADVNAPLDLEFDQRFHIHNLRPDEAYSVGEPQAGAEEDGSYMPADEALAAAYYKDDGPDDGRTKKFTLPKLGKSKKTKRPLNAPPEDYPGAEDYAAGFTDYNAAPGGYAPDRDYGEAEGDDGDLASGQQSFPSFREYLQSLVTGMLFRLRPQTTDGNDTAEEDDEDLGPEVSAKVATKYYGSFLHSLRQRFRIALALLIIMTYLSLGLPAPGMLKSARVVSAMCLGMQFTIMLLSLDVVTGAVMNLLRRRIGIDALAVLGCLLTSIDALGVATDSFGSLHMPLCAISSLSLTGVLLSSLLSARGLRKALRVPAIGKKVFSVTGELGVRGRELTLLKAPRPAQGFVRRTEEAAPDETLFNRISLILLAVAVLLAFIAAIAGHSSGDILYILSAVLAPAVPVTALLCFSLPFFVGSERIFNDGAAIAGWSGLCDIGQSRNLIVTDRDLFPAGSVEIESMRVFANESSEKIISYAGTMITASGSSLAPCFGELMEKNGCSMRQVENFEYLAGGGMKGVIHGETVLCGSTDLMRLMNVRIPFRLVDRTTVLLAIDGVLYGIFNMKYTADPKIRKALVRLMRSNRHPVFAIRDFNVTPEMLHRSFDVATDGYDFPPYVERFSISEARPTSNSKIAAVVCREELGTMTSMADTGRSMYVATRVNILLTLLSIVIGMLAVFIKLAAAGTFGVSVGFLLAYALAWALPVAALSLFLRF